jgi:hypothetical protein
MANLLPLSPPDAPAIAEVNPAHRPALISDSCRLPGVDGRTRAAKRFGAVLGELLADIGRSMGVTEAQRQLARRAASLSIWAEEQEARMARGDEVDQAAYTAGCNTLRRLLADIRHERPPKDPSAQFGPGLSAMKEPREAPSPVSKTYEQSYKQKESKRCRR